MTCIHWIVEISWAKNSTPELELDLPNLQREVLKRLESCCPYFINRYEDRYTLVLHLQAERLSAAEDRADKLLKEALEDCYHPWPSVRRKICDIITLA